MAKQNYTGIQIGFNPGVLTYSGTYAVQANPFAFGFVGDGRTLASVSAYIASITGGVSFLSTNLTVDLQASNAASPYGPSGTSLIGGAVAATTWGGAAAYSQWPAAYTTLAETQYWLVFANTNGTPASYYANLGYLSNATYSLPIPGASHTFGLSYATSSAGVWTPSPGPGNFWLNFNDGSAAGLPAVVGYSSASVYATVEVGMQFVTPTGPSVRVAGVTIPCSSGGTPVGPFVARNYTLAAGVYTQVAQSIGIPGANVASGGGSGHTYYLFPIASPVVIAGGTTIAVTLADTTADVSNNNLAIMDSWQFANAAAAQPLMPFSYTGTPGIQGVVGTNGSNNASALSAVTPTPGLAFPITLTLDTITGPFVVSAGGGISAARLQGLN